MKIYQKIILILIPAMLLFGCEKEDFTGHSSQTPTNPKITVDVSEVPGSAVSDLEKSSYTITLNTDVAQIVDVKVYVSLKEGTATEGDDFSYDHSVVIPAGRKSATVAVTINADEMQEDEENFTLTIGDERTANATITPVDVTFKISNGTNTNLVLELSWDAEAYDMSGEAIDPTDLADMVFLLQDMDFNTVNEADGASFEEMDLLEDLADGDYYLSTQFYAAMDLGDLGGSDLDLTITYNQLGVQSGSLEFPAALNTKANIDNTLYLAKLTKSGSTWTVAEFEGFKASDINFASDVWNDGQGDGCGYGGFFTNEVVIAGTAGDYTINGLNNGWMVNAWGEEILSSNAMAITFNDDGTLSVGEGEYMTTLYDGAESTYALVNNGGTWNRFMLPVALTINYDMDNGTVWGAWLYDNGYSDTPSFIADIIQGSSAKSHIVKTPKKPLVNVKPY